MAEQPAPSAGERLARNLGRGAGHYALYPPPRAFQPFSDERFCAAIHDSNGDLIPAQLALHFDIPATYRSALCATEATRRSADRSRADAYRDRLVREIGLVGGLFDRDRDVVQVSLAPGMTRWMAADQVGELIESLDRHFYLKRRGGIDFAMTVELDQPATSPLRDWVALGCNRVSIGIGPLAAAGMPAARQAQHIAACTEALRAAGFGNLRIELPYAVAGQTLAEFTQLLAAVVAAGPERVGLRNCAAQAETEGHATHDLPPAALQAATLLTAADRLEAAGYLHVGLDVFARADDPLLAAQAQGRLYRDALGFGVHGATDLIGFGVGAISQLGGCHAQNPLDLASWEHRLDRGQRPVERGIELTEDDRIRNAILQEILCQGRISTGDLEARYELDFRAAFAAELARLDPLLDEGSLYWDGPTLRLDRVARLSARAIASAFDRHR